MIDPVTPANITEIARALRSIAAQIEKGELIIRQASGNTAFEPVAMGYEKTLYERRISISMDLVASKKIAT